MRRGASNGKPRVGAAGWHEVVAFIGPWAVLGLILLAVALAGLETKTLLSRWGAFMVVLASAMALAAAGVVIATIWRASLPTARRQALFAALAATLSMGVLLTVVEVMPGADRDPSSLQLNLRELYDITPDGPGRPRG
jgi:hypothetical protein